MVLFCDGAMVVNFVANVMMNGVCCIHQAQHEEERKQEYHDALRRTMNVEWQRRLLMERELEEQRLRARGGVEASNREAEERRRLLMLAKQNATCVAAGSAASSISSHDHGTIGVPDTAVTMNDNAPLSDQFKRVCSGATAADGRSTISTSSLLDNEDDDDEEDDAEGEFENVDL